MTNSLRKYLISHEQNVSGVLDITSDSDVGFAVIVAKNEDDVVKDIYGKHIEIRREIVAEVYDERRSFNVANGSLLEERLGSELVKVEFRDITIFRPFVFVMVTVKTPRSFDDFAAENIDLWIKLLDCVNDNELQLGYIMEIK